jgi:ATP-dependent Clp protease protease subunit
MAASMGAVLLAAGTPGKRIALPNSKIMIHQPSGGMRGTAADIEIHAQQILKDRKRLYAILANHTGKDPEQIAKDSDRDYFMEPGEALDYGLIDKVQDVTNRKSKSDDEEE